MKSANEAYYILQGTKTWNPYNYPSTGWYKLGVKSITVTHSGDGTGKSRFPANGTAALIRPTHQGI